MAGKEFFHSDNPFNEMLTRVFNLLELNLLVDYFQPSDHYRRRSNSGALYTLLSDAFKSRDQYF